MDSLFKNILLTLKTIDICVINLFQDAVTFKAFSKNALRQLFHLGTKESHFLSDDTLLMQSMQTLLMLCLTGWLLNHHLGLPWSMPF